MQIEQSLLTSMIIKKIKFNTHTNELLVNKFLLFSEENAILKCN